MKNTPLTLVLLSGLSLSGGAQAALIDRGGGLIYDDVLNITWLQDANYAKTSGYDADGNMTWHDAMAWANQLVYGGLDDWRLPKVLPVNGGQFDFSYSLAGDTDYGFNITSIQHELSHLFHLTLGNQSYMYPAGGHTGCYSSSTSPVKSCFVNKGPFFASDYGLYWSSTDWSEFYYDGRYYDDLAFSFEVNIGFESNSLKTDQLSIHYAWAVRDGDVLQVPEPMTLPLMLTGLVALGVAMKKRKSNSSETVGDDYSPPYHF